MSKIILLRFVVLSIKFNPKWIENILSDMNTKEYIKKVLITDELSTPEARADRLKRLRNLTNLSRKEICEFCNLNLNTYKGWELGRFGGLPADGAEKIISHVIRLGVICTTDWLLYGKDPSPSLASTKSNLTDGDNIEVSSLNLIEKEFTVFQSLLENALLERVDDDSVLPNFKEGDYLAGVKLYDQEISLAVNQLCIVQTIDGKKLIRYLKRGTSKDCYSLISTNPLSKSQDLAIINTRLLYAAPIYRHYIVNNNTPTNSKTE
ncbi:hypothetical protein BN59_03707 [Legionella massiliensis]|uniref:Peptidase S24/S26A/S26B/S26C domain-containing protein n=1 Tax=Legionella massiliensis TaxID=1034943 RepID=A0A078L5M2_9GAMM|nr:hypothetical protein [Legionella massiliensis]CDZ79389.1 hypothetical protein BN59_03707 [Legionella massiliensis]CEE15127.1 hypothetical protein BN1094_03707 [Legionella massiliensis]